MGTRLLCPWGFSRQEYWSGLPCPPPGDLPNPALSAPPPEGLPGARTCCPPAGTGAAVLSGGLRAPAAAGARSVPPSPAPSRHLLSARHTRLHTRDGGAERSSDQEAPGFLLSTRKFSQGGETRVRPVISGPVIRALLLPGPFHSPDDSTKAQGHWVCSSGSDLQKFPSGNGSPANLTPEPDSPVRGCRPWLESLGLR